MAGDTAVRSLLEKMAECASNAYLGILERYSSRMSTFFYSFCSMTALIALLYLFYFFLEYHLYPFFLYIQSYKLL